MTFDAYIKAISPKTSLSNVKLQILKELWNASDAFPKAWVESKYLLGITNQKYFDRRVRELKDHNGCDIEIVSNKYRLKSDIKYKTVERDYLSSKDKIQLFERHQFSCNICGKRLSDGKGLQADHRIPVSRGGGSDISNWQAVCVECNVGKRRACVGCEKDCAKCPWAIPEIGISVMVTLGKNILDEIHKESQKKGLKRDDLILKAIEKYLA